MSARATRFGSVAWRSAGRVTALLVIALAVLALPRQAAPGVRARYGGELTVALQSAPRELDPARAVLPADLAAVRAVHATLLEVDASGTLRPALLEALPEVDPGGRVFRLRLRSGLRFHDGSPVTAAEVAASLSRLLQPAIGSPYGWIAWPIEGAQAVREGRAAALSGIRVLSQLELRIVLESPFPEFPYALATLPSAVLPRSGPPWIGTGDFRVASLASTPSGTGSGQVPLSVDGTLHLAPFEGHWRGRPFLDGMVLAGLDPRRAERAFERGDALLALLPEALPRSHVVKMPALSATYAAVSVRRLGARAQQLCRILAALDRSELIRLFVRGTAEPLTGLLPPALSPAGAQPVAQPRPASSPLDQGKAPGIVCSGFASARRQAEPASSAPDAKLTLLISAGADFHRAVADRIQVKLFDQGVTVAVESSPPDLFAARLSRGDFDLALVPVTFLTASPIVALLQASFTVGGPEAARAALRSGGAGNRTAPARTDALGVSVVPLYVTALSASAHPSIAQGPSVFPDGRIDLGGLWILPKSKGR